MTDPLTVGAVIAGAAQACGDAPALWVDERTHSFRELDEAGTAVAAELVADGATIGDVALVLASTSFDLCAEFVGCARAGVVFAPLNPELPADVIDQVVATIEPAFIVTDHQSLAADTGPQRRRPGSGRRGLDRDLPEVDGANDHVAFFTSGSSGAPKAAVLHHQTSVLRSHPGSQLEPRGPALCPYPLFHMGGWTIALQQWHARNRVVFSTLTDPANLAKALTDHRIERFNAIPALWHRLIDHATEHDLTFPHLRFADTGTSATPVELLTAIGRIAPNAAVRVFYGSTEAGNVASLAPDEIADRPGCCGQPSVLTETAISAEGELLVRGPLVFDRYLNDADATAAALGDGWYHTGDLADTDRDGYLTITGRASATIRTGGETVAPERVEQILSTHPIVGDVAVVGLADDTWGEIVAAAVTVRSDDATAAAVPEQLLHWCGEHDQLARHERPRRVLVVPDIPRTAATGQVDRAAIQRRFDELA